MADYNIFQTKIEEGIFVKYHEGYYTFRFEFDELIVFEQLNKRVLEEFNLRGTLYIGSRFNVTYEELLDESDDDDFIIFRLRKLELINS